MTNYIETFCYTDGQFQNLHYHRQRVVRTLTADTVWLQIIELLATVHLATTHTPIRFTVEYNSSGIVAHRAAEYQPKTINRLIPVETDIDYHLKYADRSQLDELKCGLAPDEEPLIVKNGLVTDTTFSNVVFRSPGGTLYTPRIPLLEGTRRAQLLHNNIIRELDIAPSHLSHFTHFYLINAMRPLP